MPADNPRIFISYSRKDGETFATALRQKLIAIFGENQLWQDRAKMEGGVGWWSQIEEALEKVEFMVLVATPEAMKSPIVAKEWRRARQEGVCVYPVQVPGLPIDFNALPRWMADSHFYNLDKEWDTFVNYLKSPCTAVKVPFMPPPLPEHFVQRPAEFNALRDLLLDADRQNPLAITTALKGAGGFGKTTLAAALCHDEDVQTAFDDGILWATLGEQPDVLGALTKLYAALTGERPAFVDAEDAANNLADKLADRDCLIVIDDAWNTAHLRPFLRGGERCARLITTRIMDVALEAEAQPLTVDEMETGEAAQMLIAGIQPKPTDPEPFRRLAKQLGEWPLALKLANGAIRKRILRRDTPEKAARWLEDELNAEGIQVLKSDTADQRSRSAGATLEITFQTLDENERIDLRHRFATLGVFYEDTDIPFTALAALWGCTPREAERHATRLDDLSLLLRLDLESGTIRLHDVVRQYALSQLTDAPAQHTRLLDGWGDPYALPDAFAWMWYIYHLREAERDPVGRLLDFRWLRAKLFATNPNALLADFDLVLSSPLHFGEGSERPSEHGGEVNAAPFSNSPTAPSHTDESPSLRAGRDLGWGILPLLQSAVRLSLHVLALDPRQLPAQLNGRLAYHSDQSAVAEFLDSIEPAAFFPINPHPTHLPAGGSLLRILTGHSGPVSGALLLPDERILSWSYDTTLRLWSSDNLPLVSLTGHSGPVSGALLLPDERILSWSEDTTLRLWSSDGHPLAVLTGHSSAVSGALLLPDERILSWSYDTTLRLWSSDGHPLAVLTGHSRAVSGALLLPDKCILSWSYDTTLRLWSSDGHPLAVLKGHSGAVSGALLLPDERILSWAGGLLSTDRTLRLWSSGGHPLAVLKGHSRAVSGALLLPNEHILSWSEDTTLRLWSSDGRFLASIRDHFRTVSGVLLLPNGRFLSWSEDTTFRLWSFDGRPLAVLKGHSSPVSGALLLSDERILSWSEDATLSLWSSNSLPLASLTGHSGAVSGILLLPDERILSWSEDTTLHLWSSDNLPLVSLIGHSGAVSGALLLPDERILSWSYDKTLRLWSSDGRPLAVLNDHSGAVSGAIALPDGRFLSWSYDNTLRLWSSDGRLLAVLKGHSSLVSGALLLPDERILSWSYDKTLRLWSSDGRPLAVLNDHSGAVSGALLLPNKHILSSSKDKTLRLWSFDGRLLAVLKGHSGYVSGALLFPDGRFLSWSADHTLRLWSSDGKLLDAFYGDAPVTCCVLGQDNVIVAGDRVGRVLFLRLVE